MKEKVMVKKRKNERNEESQMKRRIMRGKAGERKG